MFFDSFPKIRYDINRNRYSNYQVITNILFRYDIIKKVLDEITTYYEYTIRDGDRPEILSERIYGNGEAYWIICYANDIKDPQFDWPMNYDVFNKYLVGKYGSIANAQTTYHHYEKVIQRTEQLSNITTETRFQINYDQLTENNLDVPYDTYLSLPETQSIETINMNGRTVVEKIFRDAITNYDYEETLNESKRKIKIIRPEYYPQIMREFERITGDGINKGTLRKLIY